MPKRYVPTHDEEMAFNRADHTWVPLKNVMPCEVCGLDMNATWWRGYMVFACSNCENQVWEVD